MRRPPRTRRAALLAVLLLAVLQQPHRQHGVAAARQLRQLQDVQKQLPEAWGLSLTSGPASAGQPLLRLEIGPASPSGAPAHRSNVSGAAAAPSSGPAAAAKQQQASSPAAANASSPAANASSSLAPQQAYVYTDAGVSGDAPPPMLGMPLAPVANVSVAAWVMCAWAVSNFSSSALLSGGALAVAEGIITRYFSGMAPGQVQLAAAANVSVGWSLGGLRGSVAGDAAAPGGPLTAAAAAMAGGFDRSHTQLMLSGPPDYGSSADEFSGSGRTDVVQRQQALPSGRGSGARRRLMLAQAQAQQLWVVYSRMAPPNASVLVGALSESCGGGSLTRGRDVSAAACGQAMRAALGDAGVAVDDGAFAMRVEQPPLVSLSVRLAVAISEAQAAAGLDRALAEWLSQPRNIRNAIAISGVPDPVGSAAIIRWLHTPEIWSRPAAPPRVTDSPGFIAGVAVGGALLLGLLLGLAGWGLHRRRSAAQAAKQAQAGSMSSAGGSSISDAERRRRRRQGKRRYLMPQLLPRPDEEAGPSCAAGAAGDAGAAGAAAAAAAAAGGGGAGDDGELLDPDAIRPAMKELGDSVTSAARFEADDEEQQQAGQGQGQGGAEPGGSGSTSQRVLAARVALLTEQQQGQQQQGVGGAASAHIGGVGAAAAAAASRVLPAGDDDDDGSDVLLSSRRGGPAPAGPVVGAAAAAAAAAAVTGAAVAAGAASHSTQDGMPVVAGEQAAQHHRVQPPPPLLAAGRACSVGATSSASPEECDSPGGVSLASLASPVALSPGRRASPFALSYDFGELADAAPHGISSGAQAVAAAAAAAGGPPLPCGSALAGSALGAPPRGVGPAGALSGVGSTQLLVGPRSGITGIASEATCGQQLRYAPSASSSSCASSSLPTVSPQPSSGGSSSVGAASAEPATHDSTRHTPPSSRSLEAAPSQH